VITQGKNRQIRRLCARSRFKLLHLHRAAIGPLQLDTLTEGQCRPLTRSEILTLYALVLPEDAVPITQQSFENILQQRLQQSLTHKDYCGQNAPCRDCALDSSNSSSSSSDSGVQQAVQCDADAAVQRITQRIVQYAAKYIHEEVQRVAAIAEQAEVLQMSSNDTNAAICSGSATLLFAAAYCVVSVSGTLGYTTVICLLVLAGCCQGCISLPG
jgi:hypothetical protein